MKKFFKQLLFAYAFLTIIPGLGKVELKPEETGKSTVFYPVVGVTIGIGLYPISLLKALTPFTISVLMCAFIFLFSRALHADGLIDTIDGFLSGKKNKEDILFIMKDSRVGALGLIGAFSLYLIKISMFYEILRRSQNYPPLLMAVPALSRGGVAIAGWLFPYASEGEGFGKSFVASIGAAQAIISFILMVVVSISRNSMYSLFFAPFISLFWILWGGICKRKIGGITGDTIGAGIEISEVLSLVLIYAIQFLTFL